MTEKHSGLGFARFCVCEEKARKPKQIRQPSGCHQVFLALALVSGVMVTPDVFNSYGFVQAQQENSLGEEIDISKQPVAPIKLAPVGNGNNMGNGNQTCEIIVVSPGSIGASIENKVLSSKLMGGRAGTAHINATNSSYSLSVDNPVGFTAMPAGGSDGVIMTASFMGNGDTNFSETPGNYNVRIKRGLTIVQTHMTAERTNGIPFPAGYYSAEITLRCE